MPATVRYNFTIQTGQVYFFINSFLMLTVLTDQNAGGSLAGLLFLKTDTRPDAAAGVYFTFPLPAIIRRASKNSIRILCGYPHTDKMTFVPDTIS